MRHFSDCQNGRWTYYIEVVICRDKKSGRNNEVVLYNATAVLSLDMSYTMTEHADRP